ncbi:MAG: hypothetical protein UZ16_OP3001000008 [Candidatus Hinthialibacteria bacterium OLB16]|nr:MAG: hypothetical protein UZ16_OP3001000008 [Candidatus Hinthialibacteria bacterium OLB16]
MRFRLFGTLLLFTGLVLHTAIFAAEDVHPSTGTVTTLNPLQLEAKFQQAYSRIDERYIEDIQSITFMIGGFKEMLTLAGLENLKYPDIVSPKQRLGSKKMTLPPSAMRFRRFAQGPAGKLKWTFWCRP